MTALWRKEVAPSEVHGAERQAAIVSCSVPPRVTTARPRALCAPLGRRLPKVDWPDLAFPIASASGLE